jgi:hypothetical protein
MTTDPKHNPSTTRSTNSDKAKRPGHKGGSAVANARKWGGGSKASKGAVTEEDKHNPNSSAHS